MRIFFTFLCLITVPTFNAMAADCGLKQPCKIDERSYYARTPDGWDGASPLPVLLHFHGWGRQGKMVINNGRIAGTTRKQGVLLLAPNGLGKSWSIWGDSSRDIDFANAILKDAIRKWPIDPSQLFVSGYSWGGVMAWFYACAEGAKINTVLSISGTFGDDGENCKAPVNLRHVHGLRDTVMDYPYGPDGEVEGAVSYWRRKDGCGDTAAKTSNWKTSNGLPLKRYSWLDCSSGKSVILDTHKRGHLIPKRWLHAQLRDLLR